MMRMWEYGLNWVVRGVGGKVDIWTGRCPASDGDVRGVVTRL